MLASVARDFEPRPAPASRSLGQAGAAVAASMGRAKLCGLLIDRREDVTRRPTRDPDAPAEVAVEVWLREVVPQTGD